MTSRMTNFTGAPGQTGKMARGEIARAGDFAGGISRLLWTRKQPQPLHLPQPVGLQLGESRLCGAGAGDRDEQALGIGDAVAVALDDRAQAAAEEIPIV